MNKSNFTVSDDKKTLIMERTFNSTKDKFWDAYTEAEALEKWWGPVGWETEVKKLDFSEGGSWFYIMKCVDENQGEWFGKTSAGIAVYKNIKPKDSFEYTDYFADDDGNIKSDMPSALTTFELRDNQNGTTTLITKTSYDTEDGLKQVLEMGMEEGFAQTLDRLEEYLG